MADYSTPFATTGAKRLPSAEEISTGFPTGALDKALFNGLFFRLQSEINEVIKDAGLTPNNTVDTWLRDAIRKLINDAIESLPGGADDTVLTNEQVQDIIGGILRGAGVVYNDAANTITINGTTIAFASGVETQTGTVADKAVTPASLSSRTATTTRTGLIELATDAEVKTGTDAVRAITPKTAKDNYIPRRIDGISGAVDEGSIDYIPFDKKGLNFVARVSSSVGAIEFEMPQMVSTPNTMMSFDIELLEFSPARKEIYKITAYATAGWSSSATDAYVTGNGQKLPVHFRYDAATERHYVYIGNLDTNMSHPAVMVKNISLRFQNAEEVTWNDGINVSLVTAFKGALTKTVDTNPTASGAEPLDVTGAIGTTSYVTTPNAVGASTRTNLEGVTPSTWTRVYALQVDDANNGTTNTYLNVYRRTA